MAEVSDLPGLHGPEGEEADSYDAQHYGPTGQVVVPGKVQVSSVVLYLARWQSARLCCTVQLVLYLAHQQF